MVEVTASIIEIQQQDPFFRYINDCGVCPYRPMLLIDWKKPIKTNSARNLAY